MLTVYDAQPVSVSIDGSATYGNIEDKQVITIACDNTNEAWLLGALTAVLLDNVKALKKVTGLDDASMTVITKRNLMARLTSDIIPFITGVKTYESITSKAQASISNVRSVSDAELATLGIKRDSIIKGEWMKYSNAREKQLLKLTFVFKKGNSQAIRAIESKLADYPAFTDAGVKIPPSVSTSADSLDSLVYYCDITTNADDEEFDI